LAVDAIVPPMKSRLILLLLAAHAGAALAQYKCTGADGRITFQQLPCPGAKVQEKLDVIPNGHPPPASGVVVPPVIVQTAASASVGKTETNVDKKMLARYQAEHEREGLEQALRAARDDRARRASEKLEALAAARRQFGDDPANAQPLRDALAAIGSRHDALAVIDDDRVRAAQDRLDAWDKAHR